MAAARRLGDEIKVLRLGGMQRRSQRRLAGVGDGPRRKPRVAIRVVRICALKIGAVNRAAVAMVEQSRIDGGGVALEAHSLLQTIAEDARD